MAVTVVEVTVVAAVVAAMAEEKQKQASYNCPYAQKRSACPYFYNLERIAGSVGIFGLSKTRTKNAHTTCEFDRIDWSILSFANCE